MEKISSNLKSLKDFDPELHKLIEKEELRQFQGIELIASENYTSKSVLDCLGSCLTNKYSEGQVGARYYGGNEVIDEIEQLCKDRALKAFSLDENKWGVNVQPYSGSPANFEVYVGLLSPGDKIMGLDLPSGGHLSHGYQTETKKISVVSIFFESKPYKTNQETGLLDYEQIQKDVSDFKPKMLVCGYSAYSRDMDYKKFREIADSVGAFLMADIAHISGLVASKEMNNPFEYCDVVTTTTHKTLRGPRSGMIFYKIDERGLKGKIDFAVFPGCQGGPHNNVIAGIATQLKEIASDEFKEYAKQVISNSKHMAKVLLEKGHKIATGGTDNHLFLLDLRPHGLTGSKVEKALDIVGITVNKNSIVGDKSAISPGAIRIGTPAVTSRGMKEKDMEVIANLIDKIIQLCIEVQKTSGKTLKEFTDHFEKNEEAKKIHEEVIKFSINFDIPGFDVNKFKK